MNSSLFLRPYFELQYHRLHRWMLDAGLPVWLGYVLGSVLFVFGSFLLFQKTEYAAVIYTLIAVQLCLALGEVNRTTFLKIHYSESLYLWLRRVENSLVAFPFALFLLAKGYPLFAVMVGGAAFLLASLAFRQRWSWVLPTPFSRRPFEFSMGFRGTWHLILLAYFLVGMAVWVGNFNLGIAALLFLFLVFSGYYTWQEPIIYVWYHRGTPINFLQRKAVEAWMHATVGVIPLVAALVFVFPEKGIIVLLALLLGYVLVGTMLLAKYAAYPASIGLKQGILIALGLYPPILLLLVAIYFYRVAKKQLNIHL
jgi:hypothetical protein